MNYIVAKDSLKEIKRSTYMKTEFYITHILILYGSILLHCIGLTLRFAFMPSMCNVDYYSLVVFSVLTLNVSA
jgi:hypothetical protein